MSKESYAIGFCKVAEAAGVDPVVLAKFAQQYKTDGYSPKMDEFEYYKNLPMIDIPRVFDDGGAARKTLPYRADLEITSKAVRDDDYARLWANLNPKFVAWSAAHTNAATKALAPLIKAKYPRERKVPQVLGEMIAKIYHDEMKRTTSAPPESVSPPISIKKTK